MLAEGSAARSAAARPAGRRRAALATFLTVGLALAPGLGTARADEAIARAKQCEACHASSTKRIGPSWDAIAGRYRGRPEVAPMLAGKIRRGGAGAWGAVPMPANTHVDEAEATRLVAWILARPPQASRP